MAAPTFILDGSNLAWLGPGDGPALAPVDAIADTLRAQWPGCKVITVCDASLRHRLDARDRAEHQRRTKAGELVEAPADEDADAYILAAARQLEGCVVTRDLYRDRPGERAGVPMLRPALIGGAVVLGEPKVYASADAERSEAVEGFGERVAPGPLPGGAPVAASVVDDEAVASESSKASEASEPPKASEPSDQSKAPEPSESSKASKPSKASKASKASKPSEPPSEAKASEPEPEPEPKPKPKPKPRKRATKSKATPKTPPPAPASQTALGAVILLALIGGAAALGWWLWADPAPPPAPRDPGVYVVRSCRAWQIADDERIVLHPRPGECVTSVVALGPGRLAATVEASETRLVVVDGDARGEGVTLGPVELDARLIGAEGDAVLMRLAEGPALAVVGLDGVERRRVEAWGGGVRAEGAVVLSGPGATPVWVGGLAAIEASAAAGGAESDRRLAPWVAVAPGGGRYAVVEETESGAVVVVETAKRGVARRMPLPGRWGRSVDGLAWGPRGLYATAGGGLLLAPLDGEWRVVARKAERVAEAL